MQIGKLAREERDMVLMMRQVRQEFPVEKLAIVLQQELDDEREWLAQRDYENQLMLKVIDGMIAGKSPCEYCEELAEGSCKGGEFGCSNWWLRFLTDEEKNECRKRVDLHGVVEKENTKPAAEGDGRAPSAGGAGGGSEPADVGGMGGGTP